MSLYQLYIQMGKILNTLNLPAYKVVPGKDKYNHYFGGETWQTPICTNCNKPIPQLFTFDLNDIKFRDLFSTDLSELPLISCFNCSLVWSEQVFQIKKSKKEITVLFQEDKIHWICEQNLKHINPFPKCDVKIDFIPNSTPYNEDSYYEELDEFDSDYPCRLLGTPLLLQNCFDIFCPQCKEKMVHFATISGDPYNKSSFDTDFFIGEMYVYFMFCPKCQVIKTFSQGS